MIHHTDLTTHNAIFDDPKIITNSKGFNFGFPYQAIELLAVLFFFVEFECRFGKNQYDFCAVGLSQRVYQIFYIYRVFCLLLLVVFPFHLTFLGNWPEFPSILICFLPSMPIVFFYLFFHMETLKLSIIRPNVPCVLVAMSFDVPQNISIN